MKKNIFIALVFISSRVFSQIPEDALRLSWVTPSGTAREQAIGGTMGSIGGDITSTFVNPAGLGFYKTSEMVISPGLRFLSSKGDFRGTSSSANSASRFNLGTSGFVFGFPTRGSNTAALSIAVNRSANFNSNIFYKGQNDYSSFAEQYAEEFANSGLSINDGLSSSQLSYGTRMALYTYLIDTATINGVNQVIALPMPPNSGNVLNQQYQSNTRGGITEIAIGLASNHKDRFYIGGSLGVPIVHYTRDFTYTETDATNNPNNDFASFTYKERFTTKGFGLNAKIGAIYKPIDYLRIGLAIHTPILYALTDDLHSSMITNTENYAHTQSMSSDSLNYYTGTSGNSVQYSLNSPWKFLISASYLFGGGISDVSKQKGFITADLEYVTLKSLTYKSADPNAVPDSYYTAVNDAIKYSYKGNFNFRLGGEMKFNTFMGRLGFSYSTSPYTESSLKANRMFISGGVGYRNKGMFIDLTYIQNISKDVNFPYRLADKANTFANLKDRSGTLMATVGLKF
jgi:hypothetical protein